MKANSKRSRGESVGGREDSSSIGGDSSRQAVWGNVSVEEEHDAKKRKEKGQLDISEEDKEKANFGLSGALAKDENTGNVYNGVILKWTEPLDAKVPSRGWRVYVFKGEEVLETLHLHRQSAYLFGREARVADHVLGHPSCSKQHAVIQFRYTASHASSDGGDGNPNTKKQVRPYLLDLNSANKTFLNGKEIEGSRFIELRESDVIKFGHSTRDYVLVHEKNVS